MYSCKIVYEKDESGSQTSVAGDGPIAEAPARINEKGLIMKTSKEKNACNPKSVKPWQAFLENITNRLLAIRTVATLLKLMDQYRYPKGRIGRYVANQMNKEHEQLTLWGLSKIKISSHETILDVGCGGGKTVNKLAQLTPQGKVFGVDISPEMVKYSKKMNKKLLDQKRVQIVKESVEKMSFPDNYFDLVTAVETYFFWPNFLDALKEIKRVLKSGGTLLLLNEMIKNGDFELKNAKLIEKTHMRLIPLQEIRNVMLSIGFIDVQLFTKADSPWNAVIAQKK